MSSHNSDTRTRILESTWRLMEQHRGQGVRIQDIAKAAGVSRQAVYLHFPSRAELLIATTRYVDEIHQLDERLRPLREAENAVESLNAFVVFWADYIPEVYGLAKALLALYETDSDAAAAWDDRMEALRQGCWAVVKGLKNENILAPEWNETEAVDWMWMLMGLQNWENLTRLSGWSPSLYIRSMQTTLQKIFVRQQ
ncbi:MAG TPA: TetR/AcrR family transcriptional regulator [Anaerolineales bacterium]